MASSCTYAFFQSAVEVPHCLLQHLSWDTTNFVLDSLFQFIQCPWPSRVDPILKVAPQEKITNGQIRWSWGPGNVTESWDDTVTEQFSHSCHWLPCSVRCRTILLKPGFVKLWKIVQCRGNKRLQHLNIPIRSDSHCDPLFIFEKVRSDDPVWRNCTPHHHLTAV